LNGPLPAEARVLVVRVGAMGDVLHSLAGVAALRAMRPGWQIDWVVDPRWAALLVGEDGRGPVVSGVHQAETRAWSRAPLSLGTARSVLGLRRFLQEGRYDAVVDMQGTLRSAVIGSFARARRYAGFADPRERAAGWFYKQKFGRRGPHVVEQGAALLGLALDLALEPMRACPLPREGAAERWAEALVAGSGPVALLAPTAGWGAKQWPAEKFGELGNRLAKGFRVLVNAAREDEPTALAVVRTGGGSARIVVCGVGELVALTRRVALVVGGDSGPVHLAAALGVPVVALYGPTDPARNGPWGAGPVRVLRDPASVTSYKRVAEVEAGLARVGVDEVLGAVLAMRV